MRTNASLTGALVTGVFNDSPIALTAWAGNLSLHGSQHGALLLNRVSLSLTGRTGHCFGSRFAHGSMADFAGHIGIERNLLMRTKTRVLQSDCNLSQLVATLASSRRRALVSTKATAKGAAEHRRQNVAKIEGFATVTTTTRSIGATDVVHTTFFWVGEGFIGN